MGSRQSSIDFDEAGKATATRGVGQATTDLITKYNTLVDAIVLLQEPDVIAHLLKGDNAKQHPQPIQNAVAGISSLLDSRIAAFRTEGTQVRDNALAELRTQLEDEAQQAREQLREAHVEEIQAITRQTGEALDAKQREAEGAQRITDLYRRLDIYNSDIYGTLRDLVQTFGLHPEAPARLSGATLLKKLQVSVVDVTLMVSVPGTDNTLRDSVVVSTANGISAPRLMPVILEIRKDIAQPGLTPKGRQQLVDAVLASSPKRFAFMDTHYTEAELAAVYDNVPAARAHFGEIADSAALTMALAQFGGAHLLNLRSPLGTDGLNEFDGVDETDPYRKASNPYAAYGSYSSSRRSCSRGFGFLQEQPSGDTGESFLDTPGSTDTPDVNADYDTSATKAADADAATKFTKE